MFSDETAILNAAARLAASSRPAPDKAGEALAQVLRGMAAAGLIRNPGSAAMTAGEAYGVTDEEWFRGQGTAAFALFIELIATLAAQKVFSNEIAEEIIDLTLLEVEKRQARTGRSEGEANATRAHLEIALRALRARLGRGEP